MPHYGDARWNSPCGKIYEKSVYVNVYRGATIPPVYTDAETIIRILPSNVTDLSAASYVGPAPEEETDGYITLATFGKGFNTSTPDEKLVRGLVPRRGLYRVYYTIEKLSQSGTFSGGNIPNITFSVKSLDDRGSSVTAQSTGNSASWTNASTTDFTVYQPTNSNYGDVNFAGFRNAAESVTSVGTISNSDATTFQLREGGILMLKLKGANFPGSTNAFSLQLKVTMTVLAV